MKPITAQEHKILHLISMGYSSAKIGRALQITTNTVDCYRRRLLTKFDARNSAELIRKAIASKHVDIGVNVPQPFESMRYRERPTLR